MIGKTISHYTILDKLGEGGMGVVYRARDLKLDRMVAIKLLPSHLSSDANAKQRFIHEAKAASSLDHPNICTIFEIDETDDGRLFIVMACYEGETLKQRLERGNPAFDDALDLAIQIAAGLAKAHEKGIVHRDIKPGNIFITRDDQVKIVDFGLAKLAGQTKLTQTGSTLGTVSYMSPEQAQGGETDARADIFSFGVVLYELFTGILPFKGEHEAAIMYSIMNADPEPCSQHNPQVPSAIQSIVSKALAKNKEKRYQSTGNLVNELKLYQEKHKMVSYAERRVARTVSSRRSKFLLPFGVVLAVLIGFFVIKPLFFERAPVAAAKPIVVITFENQTGDGAYDYLQEAIPNLLISSLEQSKYLSVITWERLHDLLKQIGKGDLKIIDKDTGFELCRMEGIGTIVVGSFVKAGDIFATDVKVLDVDTKELIKSASARGEGVGSILKQQIDELSREIARGAGLSERKIKQNNQPVAEVTTTSMEAYNYYLRGQGDYDKRYHEDARRFLERAVELDSTFAIAHLYLAKVNGQLRDRRRQLASFEKAMRYAHKATEKERLYIEAAYANAVERDEAKQVRLLNEIVERYPQEKNAHMLLSGYFKDKGQYDEAIRECRTVIDLDPDNAEIMNQLAYNYAEMEEYAQAIEYFERYAALSPGDANPFDSMAECYFKMGRLDDALAKYKEALEVKPDFGTEMRIAYIYGVRGEYEQTLQWIDRFIAGVTSPGWKAYGYLFRAGYLSMVGRMEAALSDCEASVHLFEQLDYQVGTAAPFWLSGFIYCDKKEFQRSRLAFRNAYSAGLSFRQDQDLWKSSLYVSLADVFLVESNIDSAQIYIEKMKNSLLRARANSPQAVRVLDHTAALLRVELLLLEGKIEEALTASGDIPPHTIVPLEPPYFLIYNFPAEQDAAARTLVAAGRIDDAISVYESLVTFDPAGKDRRLLNPRYHFRLARLYEQVGRTEDAIAHYDRFLDFYKDADPGDKDVEEAVRRLAALKKNS